LCNSHYILSVKYMWRDPWNFSRGVFYIDKEFAEAEDMLNRIFRTARTMKPSDVTSFPYYYGYQVTIGEDGKPRVREFGNIRPSTKGLVEQSGLRAPLVDAAVNEKENVLAIAAEMPGVNKQDIKVNVSDRYISIHAERGDKKYHADIPFDVKLQEASAKATYSNGILELKIKLKEPVKAKSKEVKVE
jgi:HSP20 family protein